MEKNYNKDNKYILQRPIFYNSKLDKVNIPENKTQQFRVFKELPGKNDFYYRYSRNGIIKSEIKEEDEILFKEHLENIKHKEEFEFNKNNKIHIYLNNKEIESNKNYTKFSELNLDEQLIQNINKMKYDNMTQIQQYIIPYIMSHKDCFGCDRTGSGKTISFLVPIVNQMLKEGCKNEIYNTNTFYYNSNKIHNKIILERNISYPISLIIVPTRELAEQIYKETRKVIHNTGIIVTKICGGMAFEPQIRELRNGCDILIGTPGRIIEHIQKKHIYLNLVKYLVIDEFDRMMEMGFEEQINEILLNNNISPKSQRCNTMFSATISNNVMSVAKKYMNDNSYLITTADINEISQFNSNINQIIEYVEEDQKVEKLHNIFETIKGNVIIFLETKKNVEDLKDFLLQRNYSVVAIHGDKTQIERDKAIYTFSTGQVPILIATDLASRGLDFPNVGYVINFDMPKTIEDYIHRIGRTGRAGNKGMSISFFNKKSVAIVKDLINVLQKMQQIVPQWLYQYLPDNHYFLKNVKYYYNCDNNSKYGKKVFDSDTKVKKICHFNKHHYNNNSKFYHYDNYNWNHNH